MTPAAGVGAVLRRAAGDGAVRPATARDRVAGVQPSWVVRPQAVEQVAAVVQAADARGWSVVPRGGGGGMAGGAAPSRCDLVLDLTGLDRVIEHVPGDLVVAVEAGVTLAALQDRLGPAGRQRLMLDAPPPPRGPAPTLGGLVAAAAAGPRRHRYGTPRDLLLGARFVLADGTVARTGGRVVKNVAGYDLCKLLVGSRGTLAVVVELTLKLHPAPAAAAMVTVERVAAPDLVPLVALVRRSPAVVTAAEALWPERSVLLRVEGPPRVAAGEAALLARAVGGRVLAPEAGERGWSRCLRRPWAGRGAVVAVAVAPGRVGELAACAEALACPAALRIGLGVGLVRTADDPTALDRLRDAVEAMGGCCDPQRVSPIGAERVASRPPAGALRLMAEVRRRFDPHGTLAPGRLAWGGP